MRQAGFSELEHDAKKRATRREKFLEKPASVPHVSEPGQGAMEQKRLLFRTRLEMARPKGFEPLTFGSGDRRSIQLSYGRAAGDVAGIMPHPGGRRHPAFVENQDAMGCTGS